MLTGVLAAVMAAGPVVICASGEVSPVLKKKLETEGRKVIDASQIDLALFGTDEAPSALKRSDFAAPLPTLPPDVLADVKKGIAGCAKLKTAACGAHVAQAAWQRYLNRVRPEVVIEVLRSGEVAVYRHDDALLTLVAQPAADVDVRARAVVNAALGKPAGRIAARPMGAVLPGERAIAEPDLARGVVQKLPALALPERCPELEVEPLKAPLALTTQALWRSSIGKPEGKLSCVFDLVGSTLQLQCGDRFEAIDLFPSTVFDDPAYQASLARHFVRWVAGNCANPPK